MFRRLRPTGRRAHLTGVLSVATVLALTVSACASEEPGNEGEPTDSYPSQDLEWIVPYGPTSGNDAMARHLAEIVKDKYPHNIVVRNIEGGSGSTAYTYLKSKAGDPHVISIAGSNVYTTSLVTDTEWTVTDFTPVALVGAADFLLMVPGDAPYNTYDELVAAAKTERLTVGTVNVASSSFVTYATLAAASGFEMDPVPFANNGELQTALLSSSVDSLIASPDDVLSHVNSGAMKALGFTGPERLPIMPDVPTFAELGITVNVPTSPYSIFLPPDVDPSVQEYWVNLLTEAVNSAEHKAYMEERYLSQRYLFGDDFKAEVETVAGIYEEKLREAGAID